jgi:Holliday junction resolvase RusA-like endonuclease
MLLGNIMTPANFETERKGFEMGNNPFMGEWKKTFNFPPVSYSNKSSAKRKFKEKLISQLGNNFVFSHQVVLTITLYLNEEKMLDTPEYGDLDNYAKTICDAIKGSEALLIDDCQIQRLDISWIDVPKESYFEIALKSSPDDFLPLDCNLYEMNDGLFYPISHLTWSDGEIKEFDIINKFASLKAYGAMTAVRRKVRHHLRQSGVPQFRTFQAAKFVTPIPWGFHKTRVADSGFNLINRKDWLAEYESWKNTHEQDDEINAMFQKYQESLEATAI